MMKRTILCVFLLVMAGLCAFAEAEKITEIFIGAGPEINADSRKGVSLGGGLIAGAEINEMFSAGIKADFFHNLEMDWPVMSLDVAGIFRYYIPLELFGHTGLFAQAEVGAILFWDLGTYTGFLGDYNGVYVGKYYDNEPLTNLPGNHPNPYPAFLGSLSVGWRFNLGEKYFVEPSVRGGYPFGWGLGVMAGIRIPIYKPEDDFEFGLNR